MNRNFFDKYQLNICKLFSPILVYNVDGNSNKASQINKIVNIVLYYKSYSEYTLLVVLSLDKQDLILSFTWFKQHNLKIDWQKGELVMKKCSTHCSGYQDLWNAKKYQL